MKYTRNFILSACDEAAQKDIRLFYTSDFINYRGKTSDTNEFYTEVVAEWVLNNLDLIKAIPTNTRESGYKVDSHDGVIKNKHSNRKEEITALEMYQQSEIPGLGKLVDYQTPLKNKSEDPVGKVDLLSFDGRVVRLLELKKSDSSETMLRCVLEGYTYLKTVNIPKLLESFSLPLDSMVVANPLVHIDSLQHVEMSEDKPFLKKLIKELDCKPLYFYLKDKSYVVEE